MAAARAILLAVLALIYIHATNARVEQSSKPQVSAPIPGRYLVLSHPHVSESAFAEHKEHIHRLVAAANVRARKINMQHVGYSALSKITREYSIGEFQGYAGSFNAETLDEIRASSDVIAMVESDQIVHAYGPSPVMVQHNATWGISRISRHKLKQGSTTDYTYPSSAGQNVMAYIIDTGIYVDHSEFEGRAKWGKTFCEYEPTDEDGNGHGTHVSGTVGGKTYGVAKKVSLTAVKVLSSKGYGSVSDVIAGIDWVVRDHNSRRKENPRARSVINMSLGGGKSLILEKALNAAAVQKAHFAVAAGNSYENACNESPPGAKEAITVGATDNQDNLACFSNHGKCVTALAPGQDITSSWIGGPTSTNTISGTSMASPHMCGLLALVQSEHEDSDFTRNQIVKMVLKLSTKNEIHGLPKKNHEDYPNCPFLHKKLASNNVLRSARDSDNSDEGKTPNRLIYNLEDKSTMSAASRAQQYERQTERKSQLSPQGQWMVEQKFFL